MKLKLLRQSSIFYKHKSISIEVWEDKENGKLLILDRTNNKQISLDGAMGEEV